MRIVPAKDDWALYFHDFAPWRVKSSPLVLKGNVGNDIKKIRSAFRKELKANRRPMRPEKWDGKTAERIAKIIAKA